MSDSETEMIVDASDDDHRILEAPATRIVKDTRTPQEKRKATLAAKQAKKLADDQALLEGLKQDFFMIPR